MQNDLPFEPSAPARLSVNLNKIALLRNSRITGVPDLLRFAELARLAGADGLTVHPRPDERHIRRTDVFTLAEWMKPYRPAFEFNIEGYPEERLFEIVEAVRPEQCTLVPDAVDVLTSDEGWRLGDANSGIVRAAVARLKAVGCRVILFVDPAPEVVARVKATGADGIEIYTGSFAAAARQGRYQDILQACADTAEAARRLGLCVNIGHDLNLQNLPLLRSKLPNVAEASIGHELTADALEMGFGPAVAAYKAALTERHAVPVLQPA